MSTQPTRHCADCQHFQPAAPYLPKCAKGHKLRFYVPRDLVDRKLGFKRKCEDFEE